MTAGAYDESRERLARIAAVVRRKRVERARAILWSPESFDVVTVASACDDLEAFGDPGEVVSAREVRKQLAPKLAEAIRADTRRLAEDDRRSPAQLVTLAAALAFAVFGAFHAGKAIANLARDVVAAERASP